MAFESLSDKLQNVFKSLRGKGRLSGADVKAALKEIKMALLEAGISFKVVRQFINSVQERAIGRDVFNSLAPGQMVIRIVHEELINLMDSETTEITLRPSNETTIIMMTGPQGTGKTTTTVKIAGRLKAKGRKPPLAACDVYCPAAVQQLQISGEKQGVAMLSIGDSREPVNIVKATIEHMEKNGYNVVILGTVGRLHINEDIMDELIGIKEVITADQTLLIMDVMTRQNAVNVAEMFSSEIRIDGVILTKLNGDTRGGAVLSIRAVTDRPVLYIGMGEKLSGLEQLYPDHTASRILGMGDILSLIEEAELEVDEQETKELSWKLKKAEFDYSDFLDQMHQIKKMGSMSNIMNMVPGIPWMKGNPEIDESAMDHVEAIILSMAAQERASPATLSPPREQRIVRGADMDISEANRIVKRFDQTKKMMKQLSGMAGGRERGGLDGMLGEFKMPFQAQRYQQSGFSALTINLGLHPQDGEAVLRGEKVELT